MLKGHLDDNKSNENQNSMARYCLWTEFGLTIDLPNISIAGIIYKQELSQTKGLNLGIASESPIFNEKNDLGKFR